MSDPVVTQITDKLYGDSPDQSEAHDAPTGEPKIRRSFTQEEWNAIADAVDYHYLGGNLSSYGVAYEDLSEEEQNTNAVLLRVAARIPEEKA